MTENYETHWEAHWKRWNVPTPNFDFTALRYRVYSSLERVFTSELAKAAHESFTQIYREFDLRRGLPPCDLPFSVSNNSAFINFPRTQLGRAILQDEIFLMQVIREKDVWMAWITSLQCLFWVLVECARNSPPTPHGIRDKSPRPIAKQSIDAVARAITMSPGTPIVMKIEDLSVTLYPRGAKFLDEGLVNDALSWLEAYPEVKANFEKALAIYLKDEKTQFRNLLDDLRKAVEELLRGILGNGKSLENQMAELGKWLDEKGIHVQVRNMYSTLLSQFSQYQNDAVKHGDDWNESEVEYMIYLTGTFMRMLLVLNEDNHRVN
jgi:hypothetical protein